MKRLIVLLIFGLFLCVSASAETWYVSTAGAGTKDGLSYANREDTFANLVWGAGDNKISPGETLYVCGLMREALTVGASGTLGNVITIRGDYSGDAGIINGSDIMSVWIDSEQGLGSTWKKEGVTTEADLAVMDGTVLTKGSAEDALNDHEWFWTGEVLYLRDDTGDPDGSVVIEAHQRDVCILGLGKSYITVSNIHAKYSKYGFNFQCNGGGNFSDVIIDSCTSEYNYYDGIIISDVGATDFTISNCTLHHSILRSGIYTSGVVGGTVENNDCYSNYEHGFYCASTDNLIIRNNSFHDNGYNGWKFQNGSSNNQAYYNLSYSNGTQGLRIGDIGGIAQNNVIYNNIFYDNAAFGIYVMAANVGANTFKNNIIHQASAGTGTSMCLKIGSDAVAQLLTLDYNSYYYPGATTSGDIVIVTGVAYYNLTEWKAAGYSQDASSVGTDPLFVDAANDIFRLQVGSPCINTGWAIEDIVPPGLFAHYMMNDNAATSAVVDETGNHAGVYMDVGGAIDTDTGDSTGWLNGALDFDGGDEYVEIADNAAFTPALTPFSIIAWVNMHDATNFMVASKGVFGTDGEWRLQVDASDRLYLTFYDETVNKYIGRGYSTVLTTTYEDKWVHLVATYGGDDESSDIKLYLNSVQIDNADSESGDFVSVRASGHAVWIGRYSTNHANGLIDNIMFFNTELSQAEVTALYQPVDYQDNRIGIPPEMGAYEYRDSSFWRLLRRDPYRGRYR